MGEDVEDGGRLKGGGIEAVMGLDVREGGEWRGSNEEQHRKIHPYFFFS